MNLQDLQSAALDRRLQIQKANIEARRRVMNIVKLGGSWIAATPRDEPTEQMNRSLEVVHPRGLKGRLTFHAGGRVKIEELGEALIECESVDHALECMADKVAELDLPEEVRPILQLMVLG